MTMKNNECKMNCHNRLFGPVYRVLLLPIVLLIVVAIGMLLPTGISHAASYETENIPWSGYWWPFSYGGLSTGRGYRGHPSPLEKYETLVNGQSRGPSLNWYEKNYYDTNSVSWGGLCPSWARAAAAESYEILPSSIDNIIFRVGDKKGLLTLCHDADLTIVGYGYIPSEFHRWLLQYIKDEKRSFTADLSTGEEVWYYPIYRYDMRTTRSGSNELVTVKIYYADDDVFPDYMGTKELSAQYTYTLHLNTNGDIIGGEWTGNSIDDHPEIMKVSISSQAACPYLDCDEIRNIARSRDDFLEQQNNAARMIDPGTYHLVLLDPDEYILNGSPGDEFYVEVFREDGSLEDISVTIADQSGDRIAGPEVLNRQNKTFSMWITSPDPPFSLIVTQDNYEGDPNIYTLTVDRKSAYQEYVHCLPSVGQWSGFALTNSGDEVVENATLVAYSKTGVPQQTLFGPANIGINEKKLFLFQDLPWRRHEYSDVEFLKLSSDRKTDMVNLFARPSSAMGGFGCEDTVSSHLVIPDTHYAVMGNGAYMDGSVKNESFLRDAPVEIRLFTKGGVLVETLTDTIEAGRNMPIIPGSKPFEKIADGGWMDIVSTSSVKLSGHQYVRSVSSQKNEIDTLAALSVFSRVQYVPHIPPPPRDNWLTELTLINPNSRENRVEFHYSRAGDDSDENQAIILAPFEKRTINLTSEFGKIPGEALFQSLLEISAEYPFVGYYSYSSTASIAGDKAGFPLLDRLSFKNELILPHVPANNGEWWTGVAIGNPGEDFVDVIAEPYGADGNLLEGLAKIILLDPGAYEVFDVHAFFGKTATDISFVKFRCDDDSKSVIGGFYLYGNKVNGIGSVESLSGANM